jgi:glycerol-3-phosphate dehydrogenase (NAD(P)+)
MPPLSRPSIHLPNPGAKRAVVIGAGSFGTAVAVLLARSGVRTTLQTRSAEQAQQLIEHRENRVYLSGVELPRELRVEHADAGVARADYVFLAVPSHGLDAVIESLERRGLSSKAAVVSLSKGLVPPNGTPPTALLRARFGIARTGCIGGPAHAREMVSEGAGLVAASLDESLAGALAAAFIRAGVVCEQSNDPVGVELAGAAKNAAALASGATESQGLNAAGAAAGHIFAEVWRRAGELLSRGIPSSEIPARVGQAVEALESVPLLARALRTAGVEAPVTGALAELIEGELPLEQWLAVVRTTVPPPARWRGRERDGDGFWRRLRDRIRGWFRRRSRDDDYEMFTPAEENGGTVLLERQKEDHDGPDHRHRG